MSYLCSLCRTRVLIKQEKRKQKEYFERNRLKSKMKLLGVLSPTKNSAVSLDLLNLYTVNQISCKKKAPETVKKPTHVNMNRDIKMPLRQYDLELPVSPHHIPSKLCLDDTENHGIHYQKLSNKVTYGPVQSSQVMDSYSIFEPQFSRTENCCFSIPSFSTELSSDRHIPKQTFTPRTVPRPLTVAFEKKNEQREGGSVSDAPESPLGGLQLSREKEDEEEEKAQMDSSQLIHCWELVAHHLSTLQFSLPLDSVYVYHPLKHTLVTCDKGAFRLYPSFISGPDFSKDNSKPEVPVRGDPRLFYSSQVAKGFPHHVSVELLLGWIQQSPFLHGEAHSHIFKGHCLHCVASGSPGVTPMRAAASRGHSRRPENEDFLATRPGVTSGEDWRSMNERQSDFIIEKQVAQRTWGENGKEISTFLKDVNQPAHSILSENCDSFVGQNMINLLSIDQQVIQKTFDKSSYDSLGNACLVTNSDENHSTGVCIGSIFTVSESTCSNSAFNKTSCPEKCQPVKHNQKEHNSNEIRDLSTFEDCYPASYENRGKHENGFQEKTSQKNIQEDPVNSMCNSHLAELHPNQSWDIGLDEILMEGGTCSLKDLDSSQGSQCTSYSPRPTESCFSSSSEMPSENEEQILKTQDQSEASNEISTKTTGTNNNFYLESMAELSDNSIDNSNAKFHKQNEKFYQYSDNTNQFLQSQCDSAHALKSKASNCILQVVKCDTGVQTDREPVMEEKLDAAIQCDILWKCACGRDVSSLRSVEGYTESITVDTTGGQDILKNN
ncbi:uncharacterized protein C12orf40 homolog [Heterocephalus glaber]|uniref:Uncharacterized protein C12orf40 homolog n=1 Tax=Heterocephalus glaber TaxID=10181 RepID=A0AAX6R3W9_HETGA|nr:uncharacterized protein C12orf40 homolog [Heterocephalus glaber]